jgi:hypothetical protein
MWGENGEVVDGLTAGWLGPHLVRISTTVR